MKQTEDTICYKQTNNKPNKIMLQMQHSLAELQDCGKVSLCYEQSSKFLLVYMRSSGIKKVNCKAE